MFCILLIAVIVESYLIIHIKSDLTIDTSAIYSDPHHNFTIKEYEKLHMHVHDLEEGLLENELCRGSCRVEQEIANITCQQQRWTDQQMFLNVSIETNITMEYNGKWICNYEVTKEITYHEKLEQEEIQKKRLQLVDSNNVFLLEVVPHPVPPNNINWIYIAAGVGVLIVLIIVGQTICIIHFKKKALAVQREARMSNRDEEKDEDRMRYSKMPGPKIKEDAAIEARESGIYEVLEHFRVPLVPEPPSLESLPRKKPIPADPLPDITLSRNSSMVLPFTNSLLKNKNKKKPLIEYDTESNLSTLERIKERPPLPLPTEEVYEAMEDVPPTPLPPRKDVKQKGPKKKAAKKKPEPKMAKNEEMDQEEVRQLKPKPHVPITGMAGHNANAIPAQLKEALEMRLRLKSTEPVLPKPLSKLSATPKSQSDTLPKTWSRERLRKEPQLTRTKEPPKAKGEPKAWSQEATPKLPREKPWSQDPKSTLAKEKPWPPVPSTLNEPMLPKENLWPQDSSVFQREHYVSKKRENHWPQESKEKSWPKVPSQSQTSERQREVGTSKINPGFNPGLPPPDAPPAKVITPWGEPLPPKPWLAPRTNPKQQLPLPQSPTEPETIHVLTEHATESEESDGEEWIYEDLPQFNIYSM